MSRADQGIRRRGVAMRATSQPVATAPPSLDDASFRQAVVRRRNTSRRDNLTVVLARTLEGAAAHRALASTARGAWSTRALQVLFEVSGSVAVGASPELLVLPTGPNIETRPSPAPAPRNGRRGRPSWPADCWPVAPNIPLASHG